LRIGESQRSAFHVPALAAGVVLDLVEIDLADAEIVAAGWPK
jgi:hypothetical protein